MEIVVVEGRYATPSSPEAVLAGDYETRFCFDLYRSHPVLHFLSPDGSRICCIFRAPDAEAVRQTLRGSAVSEPDKLWPGTLEGWPGDMTALRDRAAAASRTATLVLVERDFTQAVDFAAVQALEDRGAWCLDLHGVRFIASFFARDQRRMICLYAAPDAEAVRLTNERLGLPFEQVWPVLAFAPDFA